MKNKVDSKILSVTEALQSINGWKKRGNSIVFTNGCFDLIHAGHIDYLFEASKLGDKLIVGINSDNSVRQLKGISRPINDITTRSMTLASMFFVDAVIVFDQSTPLDLIEKLKPNTLVKGGDYLLTEIIGAKQVLGDGGEVLTIKMKYDYSSSKILAKAVKSPCNNIIK